MDHEALADPSRMSPFDQDGTLQVVIETPKGSRNKYAFDHQRHVVVLKKILPSGMVFPYDFGFVPSTLSDDGDPLDVLVLMEEPAFPGCVLDVRVIGVVEGEDELKGGATQRNDRLLAVATMSQTFQDVNAVDDLPVPLCKMLQEFFVTYPKVLSGKTYRLVGIRGPKEANDLINAAIARKKSSAD